MAHLHYVIAPAGLLKKADLPPRWGLLTLGDAGVTVTVRAAWCETASVASVEGCVARTLTGDIHRSDDRAIGSVNRALFAQQHELAQKIRALTPSLLEQQRAAADVDAPATLFAEPTAGDMMRPAKRRRVRA